MKNRLKIALSVITILGVSSSLYATCAKDIDMGGYRITNVGEPQDSGDVVTKSYLERKFNNSKVSFAVKKIDSDKKNLLTFPSIIKMDNVTINDANTYDPTTGVFTAPSDGIYKFDVSLMVGTVYGKNADGSKADLSNAKWHDDMLFYIKKFNSDQAVTLEDGEIIGKVWIGQSGENDVKWFRKAASSNVIVKLKEADKICIQFSYWDGGEEGDQIGFNIQFTGFKLY